MPNATDEYGMPLGGSGTDEYGMPLPQGAPGIPSPELPTLLPPSEVDPATRGFNQLYFANDPQASAQYLQSRGFQPAPTGTLGKTWGESWRDGGALGVTREAGARIADTIADVPRLVAMGLGATSGSGLGLPGAAGGAALGDMVASPILSATGRALTGMPQADPGVPMAMGAMEGVVGQGVGQVATAALGKAINFFRDSIDIPQGLAVLKDLFGVSNKELGKDVAAQAVSGEVEGVDKVLTDPMVMTLMKDSYAKEGNSLVNLGASAAEKKQGVADLLYEGVKDPNTGTVLVPPVIEVLDKAPNSATPFSSIQQVTEQMVHEATDAMRISNAASGNLVGRSSAIRAALEDEINTFKTSQSAAFKNAEQAASEKLALITKGGKDPVTNASIEGLNTLQAKLKPLQELVDEGTPLKGKPLAEYNALKPRIAQLEAEANKAAAEMLTAKAQAENPPVSFANLNDWKTAVGKLGNFNRLENKPDLAQGFNNFYGKLSDFVTERAGQIDPVRGAEFAELSRQYSVLSDFEQMIQPTVGAARKQSSATGLAPDVSLSGAAKALRAVPRKVGDAVRAVANQPDPMAPARLNNQFSQAIRKLPNQDDPTQQFRGNMLTNAAAGILASPVAAPVIGTKITRNLSSLIPSAHSQEPDLKSLQDGIMLSTLVDNGMVPPEARQTGFDYNQLDPATQQQVGQIVSRTLQPLQDALKFGNEDEVGAAFSQVVKAYPELFPPPRTGIKGEVTDSQGRIKLYDPTDRARYASKIQVDSGMDWSEKAKVVSELNSTFTVINPKKVN